MTGEESLRKMVRFGGGMPFFGEDDVILMYLRVVGRYYIVYS